LLDPYFFALNGRLMMNRLHDLAFVVALIVFMTATVTIETMGKDISPGASGNGFILLDTNDGCSLPAEDTVEIVTAPDSIVNLGNLPATLKSGGVVKVLSNTAGNWVVTAYGTNSGHLKHESLSVTLGQALKVTGASTIDLDGNSNPKQIFPGSGKDTDCIPSEQEISYTQHVNEADNANPGIYTITVTYTASKVA